MYNGLTDLECKRFEDQIVLVLLNCAVILRPKHEQLQSTPERSRLRTNPYLPIVESDGDLVKDNSQDLNLRRLHG